MKKKYDAFGYKSMGLYSHAPLLHIGDIISYLTYRINVTEKLKLIGKSFR